MKIFLVERTDNWSYNEFSATVVFAESEDAARNMDPKDNPDWPFARYGDTWVSPRDRKTLNVSCVGVAFMERRTEGFILGSYHQG